VQNLARKNLTRFGLDSRVDFKLRDIQEGFAETDADSFFLDVPNPYDYMSQVRNVLKPGGFLCCLIPTMNQVEKTLIALRQENFAFIEVCEILLRFYQAEPNRLRPTDRMVAHTGISRRDWCVIFSGKMECVQNLLRQKFTIIPLVSLCTDPKYRQPSVSSEGLLGNIRNADLIRRRIWETNHCVVDFTKASNFLDMGTVKICRTLLRDGAAWQLLSP
jgi:hypothetical protein